MKIQGSGRSGFAGLLAAGPSGAGSASDRGAHVIGFAGLLAAGPSGAGSASDRGADALCYDRRLSLPYPWVFSSQDAKCRS